MQWLVLLEAERSSEDGAEEPDLRRLLDALADPAPGGLQSADRYALQLEVEAAGPPDAISIALRRWEGAHSDLGIPNGRLVRVEVLTRDEFERECLIYDCQDDDPSWGSSGVAASQRGVEEALLRHAFHDPLTDLASQGLFRAQLEHALAGPGRAGETCGVLLLDVDRFAAVNARLGRHGADRVLVSLAQRLRQAVVPSNDVGRLGGDQFAVILRGTSVDEVSSTARRILDQMTSPVVVDGVEVRLTVSGGVALAERGVSTDDLLHRATLALRTAQNRGRARFEVYGDGMTGADVRRLLSEREAMASFDAPSYLGLLERIAVAVAECRTLEDAGFVVLRHLCDHARFTLARLYLPDEDEECGPCPVRTWIEGPPQRFGDFGHDSGRWPLREGEGLAGRALASGRPVWVRDIAFEPGLAVPHDAVAAGLRGAVALPVVVDDRTVAVLEFFADQSLEFGDALLQLLTAIGAHLATVARQASAERARSAAETRLRVLLANSGVYVKVVGPNGKVREQYPATWPDDAALPLSALEFVHPDDIAVAMRGWADALASPGLHPPFECRIATADGSWHWVEVTAMNLLDEPEIQAVVTYSREIGDRKRLEEDRRKAVAQLRDAERLARLGTWHADLITGHVQWSDEMYRILGLEPGAVPAGATTMQAMAHPDDRPLMEEQRRLVRAGAQQHFSFRVVGPNGTTRWISGHASPELDASGRVVGVKGTVQDVTERKGMERAIRESEQRLREVEAVAGVGSWRTDAATGSTVWSSQLYGILGLEPGKVCPGLDTLISSVHPEDRPAVEAHALLQHRLALPMDFECRIIRPTGRQRWVRMQLSVSYDSVGAVAAFHGLVWDTTGRIRDGLQIRV